MGKQFCDYRRFEQLWANEGYTSQYIGFVCGLDMPQTTNVISKMRRMGYYLADRQFKGRKHSHLTEEELVEIAEQRGDYVSPPPPQRKCRA
jgi:hypothetical protein